MTTTSKKSNKMEVKLILCNISTYMFQNIPFYPIQQIFTYN